MSNGYSNVGLRVRAERHRYEEEDEEEYDKKAQASCRPEHAVHIIPLILVASILILYLFSNSPTEGLVPEDVKEAGHINNVQTESGTPRAVKRGSLLQTFSVYSHRSLHQIQKLQQQKRNKVNVNKERRTEAQSKSKSRRLRERRHPVHRKSRIIQFG